MSKDRKRTRRSLALWLGLAGAVIVAAIVLFRDGDSADDDPTRFGPTRTLNLGEARLLEDKDEVALSVSGESSLIDGSVVKILVKSGRRVLVEHSAKVIDERFALRVPSKGAVSQGSYTVLARFELGDQTKKIQEALRYQPRSLETSRALELSPQLKSTGEATQKEIRELLAELNLAPRDPEILNGLDQRAKALGQRLWISEQLKTIHTLRLAIEEAGKSEFQREAFERLLLEAHVLAGL